MGKFAVLSVGIGGRIRGAGSAFPQGSNLVLDPVWLSAQGATDEVMQASAERLAQSVADNLGAETDVVGLALISVDVPPDPLLSQLGRACDDRGLDLCAALPRTAVAREAVFKLLGIELRSAWLLDATRDGFAVVRIDGEGRIAVRQDVQRLAENRRAAVVATFRDEHRVDLKHVGGSPERMDAWIEENLRARKLSGERSVAWTMPDGTELSLRAAPLRKALEGVHAGSILAIENACLEAVTEDAGTLLISNTVESWFHVGPTLRASLPGTRVHALAETEEASLVAGWIAGREPAGRGRLWTAADLSGAAAAVSWPSERKKTAPAVTSPVLASAPPEASVPNAAVPPPVHRAEPAAPERAKVEPALVLPQEPASRATRTLLEKREEPAPRKSRAVPAALAALALAQVFLGVWMWRQSKARAATAGPALESRLSECEASLEDLRRSIESSLRSVESTLEGQSARHTSHDARHDELRRAIDTLDSPALSASADPSADLSADQDTGASADLRDLLVRLERTEQDLASMQTGLGASALGDGWALAVGRRIGELETAAAGDARTAERIDVMEKELLALQTATRAVAADVRSSKSSVAPLDASFSGLAGGSRSAPASEDHQALLARVTKNEQELAALRGAILPPAPGYGESDLANSTLHSDISSQRFRGFNGSRARVLRGGFDEEGHGSFKLYNSKGARTVLLGSAQEGRAGYLATFHADGHELFQVTSHSTNGAAHISLSNAKGERRVSMTTNAQDDGVLWITDRAGRTIQMLGGGGDVAEAVHPAPGCQLEPGQVVRLVGADDFGPIVTPADRPCDPTLLGVLSAAGELRPALALNTTTSESEELVAIAGQVFCWADAAAGGIQLGDLLTSSSRPGFAMKADPKTAPLGSIFAKALEPLHDGSGLIRVWVMNR